MFNPLENNDCSVRSLAQATGSSYEAAYAALAAAGRVAGNGASILQIWKAAKALGFSISEVTTPKNTTTAKFSAKVAKLPTSLLICEDHVACLQNGVVLDWAASESLPVVQIYTVERI